jgi:hypothetical protein
MKESAVSQTRTSKMTDHGALVFPIRTYDGRPVVLQGGCVCTAKEIHRREADSCLQIQGI